MGFYDLGFCCLRQWWKRWMERTVMKLKLGIQNAKRKVNIFLFFFLLTILKRKAVSFFM